MEGPTTAPTLFLKISVLILLYNARPLSGHLQSASWSTLWVFFIFCMRDTCHAHLTGVLVYAKILTLLRWVKSVGLPIIAYIFLTTGTSGGLLRSLY